MKSKSGVEVKLPSVRETYKLSRTSIPEGESHTFERELTQKLLPNSTFQLRKTLLRIKWSSLVDESTTDRSIDRPIDEKIVAQNFKTI